METQERVRYYGADIYSAKPHIQVRTLMTIPDHQTLMLPLLREAAKGETPIRDAKEKFASEFNLTDEEKVARLPSGTQTILQNRTHWAATYLVKAGLLFRPKRGRVAITAEGQQLLKQNPEKVDNKTLKQFKSFTTFIGGNHNSEGSLKSVEQDKDNSIKPEVLTPDERIRQALREHDQLIADDLLTRLQNAEPSTFEDLIIRLLLQMGYGGSIDNAGRTLGKSGDGGVDGVIDEDALGLDQVYIQAKRYGPDNKVGSGDIRNFYGALAGHKASKGIFVTTSQYTKSALETASTLPTRIILIDGNKLARLMMKFNVGCKIEETVYLKSVDEDFLA